MNAVKRSRAKSDNTVGAAHSKIHSLEREIVSLRAMVAQLEAKLAEVEDPLAARDAKLAAERKAAQEAQAREDRIERLRELIAQCGQDFQNWFYHAGNVAQTYGPGNAQAQAEIDLEFYPPDIIDLKIEQATYGVELDELEGTDNGWSEKLAYWQHRSADEDWKRGRKLGDYAPAPPTPERTVFDHDTKKEIVTPLAQEMEHVATEIWEEIPWE